ncbi:MAG: sigma-70 family RNA polymerase sigma factor [Phycisphaerales bacterium]
MAHNAAIGVDCNAHGDSGDARASALLARIRAGDREAAAEFVLQFGPILRQRVRSKLTGGLRRLVDSADLLASVARRLDRAVAERRAWFETEAQLFSFVNTIASRIVVDKARVLNRLQRAESHEAAWARSMYARIADADLGGDAAFDTVIEDAMRALESERERRVLSLWLMGMNHNEIAFEMDANPAAVRQQWCRIRQRLASALGDEQAETAHGKSGAPNAA